MKKTFAIIASFLLLFASLFSPSVNAAGEKDIFNKVTITSAKIYYFDRTENKYLEIKDGQTYTKDTLIRANVDWHISSMKGINENDYFEFKLPTNYLHFKATTDDIKLISSEDNVTELGHYSISSSGVVRVTLNDNAVSRDKLTDGVFEFKGSISKIGTNINIDFLDTDYEDITVSNPPGSSIPELKPSQEFDKVGKKVDNSNRLVWVVYANRKTHKQWFEYLTGANNTKPATVKNLVMRDTLADGMHLAPGSLKIHLPLYFATADGKMSTKYHGVSVIDQFTEIKQGNLTYEKFEAEVIKNAPAYGVYDAKRIVVSFGDIPGNGVQNPWSDARLKQHIDTNNILDDADQIQLSLKANSQSNEISGNGVGYNIYYDTIVTGESGTYKNTASFTSEGTSESSANAEVEFTETSGSVRPIDPKSVLLTKLDGNNNELEGALFDLYQVGNPTPIRTNLESNSDGEILVENLSSGKYYFIETKAPHGHVLNTEKIEFTIDTEADSGPRVSHINHKYVGAVELTKRDSKSNAYLENAEFSLFKNSVEYRKNLITDSDGVIRINDLEVGSYYFIETKAPDGYILNTEKIEFVISENDTTILKSVVAKNDPLMGSVELLKIDADTKATLKGAEFELHKVGLNTTSKYVTDDQGIIRISGLALGDYYFSETKAPDGYVLNSDKIPFTITADTAHVVKKLTALNHKTVEPLGGVELKKIDAKTKNPLEGAVFSLYNEDILVYANLITDKNGILKLENLPYGNYSFVETTAPKGYVISSKRINFVIDENNTLITLTFENSKQPELPSTGLSINHTGIYLTLAGTMLLALIKYQAVRRKDS